MKKLIVLIFLINAAMACDTKKVQEEDDHQFNTVQFDSPFKMSQKKGVQFENDDLEIIFVGVSEDSRCPEGATCFWEGQVTVDLQVKTKNNSESIQITRKGNQQENSIHQIGEHTIFLTAVHPYPKQGEAIKQEDYKISMIVR